MEFGLHLPDALAAALGGRGHERQLGGQAFMLKAAVGGQESVDLAEGVAQDVRVAVTAADQTGGGVDPANMLFVWSFL